MPRARTSVAQDGEAIRRKREEAGLTQSQLAARIKRSAAYVSQIETMTREVRISRVTLGRLCRHLGATAAELTLPSDEAVAS